MKYMLDTNVCIYAQKKNENIIAKIKENFEEGLAISAITLAELEYGVKNSSNPEKNTVALLKFLTVVEVLPFDGEAAAEYGDICAALKRNGTPIGPMDNLIAAHAKSEGLTIVTHNVREFERVADLKIEDWY